MKNRFFVLAFLAMAACNDGDPVDPGNPSLTLSPDSVNVAVGASAGLEITAMNTSSTWQFVSRDNNVALVNSTGGITGVAPGLTYVVASLTEMPNVRDSVKVRVTSSGPTALQLLGTGVVNERWTAEIAALGNVAYTTTWGFRNATANAIKIWNVAGNQPLLVDSIIIPGTVGATSDVQISDDGQYLVASYEGNSTNNGLRIWSRANPLKPTLLRHHNTGTVTAGVHTVKLSRINGRLYAFAAVNSARLSIIDITDPAQSTEVYSKLIEAGSLHDTFIRDGVLFLAQFGPGLHIYDVGGAGRGGSPSNPVFVGGIQTKPCKPCQTVGGGVHNVWWFHDPSTNLKRYAFVGEEGPGSVGSQESTGAIHVVDVSDMANPKEVAVYEPDPASTANGKNGGAHNFVMDEASGILYAAYYNAGVRALDVRGDLSVCTAAQKTTDGRCDLKLMGREVGVAVSSGPPKYVWGVALVGNNLYASDMWNGIFKIDISPLKR